MGTIAIHFVGLCTHLRKGEASGIPLEHRMVMLANPGESMDGHPVKAHEPELIFRKPREIHGVPGVTALDSNRFRLDRVSMRIKNPAETLLIIEDPDQWRAIPRLSPEGQPFELNTAVAWGYASPASVYFDVGAGRLSACWATIKQAVGTRLEVVTAGDPELEIKGWDDDIVIPPITLESGETLVLSNVASLAGEDDEWDYLINYGLILNPPAEPKFIDPPKISLPFCGVQPVGGDIGPRCSNSNYP